MSLLLHLTSWKKYAFYIGVSALLLITISFTEKQYQTKLCNDIEVDINADSKFQNHFLEKDDILSNLQSQREMVIGQRFGRIDLKGIEQKLQNNQYIKKADASFSHSGTIQVAVTLKRPVARIVQPAREDYYINSNGETLPFSDRYTARVLLIEGQRFQLTDSWQSSKNEPYIQLVNYIHYNSFWKAIISQIIIDKRGEVTLIPQVGKQTIAFGLPQNIEEKFGRLFLFYKKIMPAKGWNHYAKVNLKFKNQIICSI